MRVEIVAVGTELLLGQIADTNSAWLGEQLAAAGVAHTSIRPSATITSGSCSPCAPRWRGATV